MSGRRGFSHGALCFTCRCRTGEGDDRRVAGPDLATEHQRVLVGAQGQGLLISTVSSNQQVAFQLALLSSFLPTFILSGFIFPITSMPAAIQAVTHIVPARYFIAALRAVVLKGAGMAVVWQPLAALAVFAAATLGLSVMRLRREWR